MRWEQFIATCASFAVVAGGFAAIYFPWRSRREARTARALEAKVAADAIELRETIRGSITNQTGQIKADMIARIDTLDHDLRDAIGEVRANVATLQDHAVKTDLAMAVQFGGNGGGIRQAINEHGQLIANLAGRFDQHLTEVSK